LPWEKNFDVNQALESAMLVFWEKGYESTSIADLIEATGVKRQSLYNAFGGKQEFFIRALLKFDTERQRSVLEALEAEGKPLESIKFIFDQAVEDPLKRGCFLVNTALEIQGHNEDVKIQATSGVEDFKQFYVRLIEQGKQLGEIPASVDTNAAASGLLAALFGMRVMGRGTCSQETLRQVADQALRLLT